MTPLRRPLLVGLAVGLAASLAAAGEKPVHKNEIRSEVPWVQDMAFQPSEVKTGGKVVIAMLSDPDSLNPYLSTSLETDDMLRLVYPQLMLEDPDFASKPPNFLPAVAESWEFSADKKTITFKLRQDAFWFDGVPITADDVRFSWQAAKNADVAWSGVSIKDFIDDAKVIDAKTVALHYKEVYPYQLMDSNDGFILPKHVFGKTPFENWKTKDSWTAEAGVGGAAYRIVEYKDQRYVKLEANPRYWKKEKGIPRIPTVYFSIIKNQQSQLDALLSGSVDVVQSVRPQDVARILENGRFRLFNHTSRAFGYVGWNCARAPFDDPDVRRAMTLAIDREDIIESLYRGYADVAASPIISAFWARDRALKPWPYDADEAASILDGKGWKTGDGGVRAKDGKKFSFTISTNSVNQLRIQACTKIQANLKEIGVEMKIEQVEPTALAERLKKHDIDAWYGAWGVATKVDEKPTWHSTSRGMDGFNWANYVNRRVDEIIDQARTMELDKSGALWIEFQQILHKEQPYTFMAEPRQLNVFLKKLRNVNSAATSALFNVEEWFREGGG